MYCYHQERINIVFCLTQSIHFGAQRIGEVVYKRIISNAILAVIGDDIQEAATWGTVSRM